MVVVTMRGNQTEVWPLEVHKEGGLGLHARLG